MNKDFRGVPETCECLDIWWIVGCTFGIRTRLIEQDSDVLACVGQEPSCVPFPELVRMEGGHLTCGVGWTGTDRVVEKTRLEKLDRSHIALRIPIWFTAREISRGWEAPKDTVE